MRSAVVVVVVVITAVLSFGFTPPVTLKTVTLSSSQADNSTQYWYAQNFWCMGLDTWGSGPSIGGAPGEVSVGFGDSYAAGPGCCACVQQQIALYRGHVAFDLSQFEIVVAVTLLYDVDQSATYNGGVAYQIPADSYATTVGTSTGTINGDNGPYYWDYDNPVTMPSCGQALTQPNCSFDVTPQAKRWISVPPFNYGFIIAGPILDFSNGLPSDNNGKVTVYKNFQLRVVYNPKDNPRAPQ